MTRWRVAIVVELDADDEDQACEHAEELANEMSLHDITWLGAETHGRCGHELLGKAGES